MNKDVQNYLSDNENNKTNKILQFIARNKESLKKAVALGVSTATLVAMLNSCDTATTNTPETTDSDITISDTNTSDTNTPGTNTPGTDKPIDDKPVVNYTADELKELGNKLASLFVKEHLDPYKDKFGEEYNQLIYKFNYLGNDIDPNDFSPMPECELLPFAYKKQSGIIFDNNDNFYEIGEHYVITVTVRYQMPSEDAFIRDYIQVPANIYEELLATYGHTPTLVKNADIKDSGIAFSEGEGYIINNDQRLSFSTLSNFDQERINAFYKVLDSICYTLENYSFSDKYVNSADENSLELN